MQESETDAIQFTSVITLCYMLFFSADKMTIYLAIST